MHLTLNTPGLPPVNVSIPAALAALDHGELTRAVSFPCGSPERAALLHWAVNAAAGRRGPGNTNVYSHLDAGNAMTVDIDEATLIDAAAVRGVGPQTPLEPGCIFEGLQAKDNEARVIALAVDRGWGDPFAPGLLAKGRAGADADEWNSTLEHAVLHLDHLAPAGFFFGTSGSLDYGVWAQDGEGA